MLYLKNFIPSVVDKNVKKAFTLIELVVAIGIMAMVVVFAGTIFKVSIGSYRTAMAQAEIMQKFRAITEQLNSDFKGIRKDAPMFIWFQKDPNDRRLDQIMFFAIGDFQSIRPYDHLGPNGKLIPATAGSPVVSNIARIQYGHAQVYSMSSFIYIFPENQQYENNADHFLNFNHRILSRRQHLLSADPDLISWPTDFINTFDQLDIPYAPSLLKNDTYEHDTNSLSQWQALITQTANVEKTITTCFGNRPKVNFTDANTLHLLMSEGVSNFTIQLFNNVDANGALSWTPENGVLSSSFGFYFNIPISGSVSVPNWSAATNWPRAIKFTFTLYDSRGVFKEGQTFTHIVYIGD
ncbi:MAG: prepilin-type N-terminal cleavage/methylation domain-containing protein [Phycisphaerae bacterium]|jgi:prepilin-type N-terminal cleavage/methylation domain-containing protein